VQQFHEWAELDRKPVARVASPAEIPDIHLVCLVIGSFLLPI
jgi:hypothetical protein